MPRDQLEGTGSHTSHGALEHANIFYFVLSDWLVVLSLTGYESFSEKVTEFMEKQGISSRLVWCRSYVYFVQTLKQKRG